MIFIYSPFFYEFYGLSLSLLQYGVKVEKVNFFNEITKDDVIIIGLSSSPKLGWGKNIIKIVQLKSLTHARIVLLVPPFINERIFYFGDDVVVIKCHGNIQDVVKKTLTALTTTPEKKVILSGLAS